MHENYDLDLLLELVRTRQLRRLRELLDDMNEVDIAEFLDELGPEETVLVFRLLPKEMAAEVFTELEDSDDQERLINALSDKELREVLDELYLDDTVDVIEDMPANVVSRILRNTDSSTRSQINQLLNYPKDSAGSIMTTEYVYLHPNATVEESFARIRKVGMDKETVYTCYVTQNRVLLGVVTVRRMLLSSYDTRIGDIMETNVLSVNTHEDKEDVAQLLNKYDLYALPVVDGENRLVGIITFDDAMDVIEEETTEDIEKMAAILPSDKPYLKTGVMETWKARIPWLLLLMLSATFTGIIITSFESALAACVVLTSFIPMLSGTGGNSGSQSSVAVIRALSLDEIEFSDMIQVVWKEIRVLAVHQNGAGPEVAVQHLLYVVLEQTVALQQEGQGPVAAAGALFRQVDLLAHLNVRVARHLAGELQQALEPVLVGVALDEGAQQDGSHIHHGVEMLAEQGLVGVVDGVKGLSRGLYAHVGPHHFLSVVHEGQQEQKGLYDTLDGEALLKVAGKAGLSVAGHHINAQVVFVGLGQLGDVVGQAAHLGVMPVFFQQLLEKLVHWVILLVLARRAYPGREKPGRPTKGRSGFGTNIIYLTLYHITIENKRYFE